MWANENYGKYHYVFLLLFGQPVNGASGSFTWFIWNGGGIQPAI